MATHPQRYALSIRSTFVRLTGSEISTEQSRTHAHVRPSQETKTMRFLSMIRINENTGQVPSEQLMSDMGALIEELTRTGQLVTTAGLRPTSEGLRVRLRRGRLSMTDGPFTETKEVIGGYAILETKTKEEAIELTQRFLRVHGDEWDIECEVRQLDGPEVGSAA
jgi:hypothetical protein